MRVGWVSFHDSAADLEREVDRQSRPAEDKGAERRRSGRFRAGPVASNLGHVVDISATGIHVITRQALDKDLTIFLRGPGVELALRAHVVRCQKLGRRKYDVGLEFIDVTAEDRRGLQALSMAR